MMSNIDEKTIKQGETLEYSWTIDGGVDLSDWTCYVQIRLESTGNLTSVDREVLTKNQENTAFILNLSKEDTNTLNPNKYIVGAEFVNTVTDQCAEAIGRLIVERQWVF